MSVKSLKSWCKWQSAENVTAPPAVSRRKVLLVNVIFEEGLVIFTGNLGKGWVLLATATGFKSDKQREKFEKSGYFDLII